MNLRTWCIRIGQILTKTGSVLNVALLLMLVVGFTKGVCAAQGITLRHQNASIEKIFQSIEKQTGYRFFYNETLIEGAVKVSLNLQNVSLQEALEASFKAQPFTYAVVERTIIVKRRVVAQAANSAPLNKIIAVRGKVTANNKAVVDATVSVKGTDNITTTNVDGLFSLAGVDDQSTLVISHISHEVRELHLRGQSFVTVDLNAKISDLDEAVVVAYNTTTQKRNTGAVTVVKGTDIQSLPYRSIDKSLQGLVPGLLVTQGSGQPGGGVANFVLRGIATGGSPGDGATVRNPLIVVDGIPVFQDPAQATTNSVAYNNPMSQLNPSDIETISVLKDASVIALYGSKASNGVILITTKKGKAGKTRFSIRHQTDISTRLKSKMKMLDQQEYLGLVYETFKNTDPVFWTDARIDSTLKNNFPTKSDGSFYAASDWINELYRSNALTTSNELSLSGGNDKSNFYLNVEYTNQNGIEKNTDFDRKSIRFNYENRPLSWIKLGLNTALSYNVQNYSYGGGGWSEYAASMISPLNPVRNENGDYIYNYSWGFSNFYDLTNTSFSDNPVAAQELNIRRNISYRGLSKMYGEIKLFKYFTFVPSVGIDFMLTEAKEKIDPKLASADGGLSPGIGRINQRDIRNANLITTNILRFDNHFGKAHSLNILAGHEAQILTNKYVYVIKEEIANNPVTDQLTAGTIKDAGGLTSKQTLLSYFGQVNYAFNDKYFLSGSVRTDGSSLFGENKRFGSHWSAGAAWLMSSESFMSGLSGIIDYFKFRGSIGSAGNSSAILHTYRFDGITLTNSFNGPAVYPNLVGSPGNRDIQWEKTFTWDAGLEFKVLQQRLGITADVYSRKTSALIGSINLPYATGYTTIKDNIGDLKNQGVELSLAAEIIRSNNFSWRLNANWSKNTNRLVKSFFPIENVSANIVVNAEGQNYNSFYLPVWADVDPASGKPQWIDSAGKPNTSYAAAKKEFVGKPQPDGFGSVSNTIRYRNLELFVMFNYQYGFQIYNNPFFNPLVNDGLDPFLNQSKDALDRWQKPGDIAANPRRMLYGADEGTNSSTRYLTDGDFIRLSNLSLGYTMPKAVISRLHLSALRIYAQGNNIAIWTKFPGRTDPENVNALGMAQYTYPLQRTYSIGLNASF